MLRVINVCFVGRHDADLVLNRLVSYFLRLMEIVIMVVVRMPLCMYRIENGQKNPNWDRFLSCIEYSCSSLIFVVSTCLLVLLKM